LCEKRHPFTGETPPYSIQFCYFFNFYISLIFRQNLISCTGIGLKVADALIGATAHAHQLPLVTGNVKHYRALSELELRKLGLHLSSATISGLGSKAGQKRRLGRAAAKPNEKWTSLPGCWVSLPLYPTY
ncbi:hypothetical protein WDW89_24380, partial [Deltaproteobacteria bacterium TL4]